MAAALTVILLVLAATSAAEAQENNTSNINVTSMLSPTRSTNSVWLSPSGIFAFGYYNTPNGYAICIYMPGIMEKTVVWTTSTLNPILPNNVDLLILQADGVVLWQNKDGHEFLYAQIAETDSTAWASMLDNGNFVLYNSDGRVIWQSFDYPTVALLPGQRLPVGGQLVSRASETDLAIGLFRIKMQNDGNLVQYPVNTPDTSENSYYSSGTYGLGFNVSLNLGRDGYLYLYDGISQKYDLTTRGDYVVGMIYLARVDPDGIFRLYNRSLDSDGNWTAVWWSMEDKCKPKGICGVNSFCSYDDQIVNCTCLPGFKDTGGGCKEDFVAPDCKDKNPTLKYEVKTIPDVTWEDNYYAVIDATEEDCRGACLNDCECSAALFKDGQCRKQRLPLFYGRRWTSNDSFEALLRVTLPAPASPAEAPAGSSFGSGKVLQQQRVSSLKSLVIIGLCSGISLLGISSVIIYYIAKRCRLWGEEKESKQNVNKFLLSHGSLAPKRYSYKEIKKITKSFAEKLGQGGYGIVYKGKLRDGQLVAVKVLTETHDNAEEFVNEVASISRTSHVNIVNLLGFCFERKKRALVYEFMPKKSLDKFIYNKGSPHAEAECSLEWNKLFEIAVGVARGLEYLHRGCNTPIVHFDIKPQNILLDDEFCPKISDFGLAKLCMKKQSVISMLGTRGTVGYIAPEVFSRNFGLVSHKSDVYSYGIMLLQMAEARVNVEIKLIQSSENYFLENIYEQVVVQNEKVYSVMTEEEEEAARKMLMVGFWCIQTAPADRPSMNNVVEMLGGNLQAITIPPLPFLLSCPKPELSCLLRVIVEMQTSSKC